MGSISINAEKDLALCYIWMDEFIKVIGSTIISMEKDMKSLSTGQFILGTIKKGNLQGMVDILGKTVKSMRGSGRMAWKTVQEYGEEQQEIHILESGKMEKQMGMEFIHGSMETDIRVNSKIVWNMEKA